MLQLAVETAACSCQHAGRIGMLASQDWVTIDTVPILVKGDLDHRGISLCQGGAELVGVTRCTSIATVDDAKSHSQFVSIGDRPAVLSSAGGSTNWSLIAVAPWTMDKPGQDWLEIVEG